MRLPLLILLLLFSNVCKIYSQDSAKTQPLDNNFENYTDDTTQINTLNETGWNYRNTNTDSAIFYVKEALVKASKSSFKTQIAKSRFYLGRLYYNKSNDTDALHNLDAALQIDQSLNNFSAMADAHMYKGYVFFHLNKTADVLNEFLLSLQCAEKSGNKKSMSNALYSMGDFYLHNGSKDTAQILKAREYFLQALDIDKQLDLQSNIATDYQYLGVCATNMLQYNEAENYLKLSLSLFKDLDDNFHLAAVYSYLGNLYSAMKLHDLSINNYQNAQKIFEQLEANLEAADIADNLANEFYANKDYLQAIKTAQHGLDLATQADARLQMFYLDTSSAKFYAAIKDFQRAYTYQAKAIFLKDSINEKEHRDKLAEVQTKYETVKKDKAITLLNTKAKLDSEKISRQRMVEIFSIVSVALLIFLSTVIIKHDRIKQELKEVNVRNQLAADLHDEIGSSLSSILLLSKMAASTNDALEKNNRMIERISSTTKEVIDKMSDIVWIINPKYDDGEDLREKLEQYISRLKELADFNIAFEVDPVIEMIKVPMEMRKTIFLIFKEATNNVLKYAAASWLYIELSVKGKNFFLKIKDDGKGFNSKTITKGNGLDTMKLRATRYGGTLLIESEEGKGTTIIATIPFLPSKQKMVVKKVFNA